MVVVGIGDAEEREKSDECVQLHAVREKRRPTEKNERRCQEEKERTTQTSSGPKLRRNYSTCLLWNVAKLTFPFMDQLNHTRLRLSVLHTVMRAGDSDFQVRT